MPKRQTNRNQPLLFGQSLAPTAADNITPLLSIERLPRALKSILLCSHARVLFLDMNSFYASVEQQENPALRGRPVIVVATMAETTTAIAASKEAKAKGIKTGTLVRDARLIDPTIVVIESRPFLYIEYHKKILEILRRHFNTPIPRSIDEMSCAMPLAFQKPEAAIDIANHIKKDLRKELGECLTASIGIGPNVFWAKIAADLKKPDGLTILSENYPEALAHVPVIELPGIGEKTAPKLAQFKIHTFADLWNCSQEELLKIWPGTGANHWFEKIRGSLTHDYQNSLSSRKKSVSQSHVLAPHLRNQTGTFDVALALTTKALERVRKYGLYAGEIEVAVGSKYAGQWEGSVAKRITTTHRNDYGFWLSEARSAIAEIMANSRGTPWRVHVTFKDLETKENRAFGLNSPSLEKVEKVGATIDKIKARFGMGAINMAPLFKPDKQRKVIIPRRISFGPPED